MKTNLKAFFFLAVFFLSAVTANAATPNAVTLSGDALSGYYINMPATGTDVLDLTSSTVTEFKVYDDGGSTGVYSANANGYLVIKAPSTYKILLTGTLRTQNYVNCSADNLTVYNGETDSGQKLLDCARSTIDHDNPTDIGQVYGGSTIMLYFKSNEYMHYDGLDLKVTFVDESATHLVSVNQKEGGTLTPSSNEAVFRKTVTLTPSVWDDYLLNGISAVDGNNKTIKVSGGYWFSADLPEFEMPYSNVSVTPTYLYKDNWTADGGIHIDMPTSGSLDVTLPSEIKSFKVYDDGGSTGSYSNSVNGYLQLTSSLGKIFIIRGSVVTESGYDELTIYDGVYDENDVPLKLLDAASGTIEQVGSLHSTNNVVTFYFHTDNGGVYSGLDLTVEIVDKSTPHEISASDDVIIKSNLVTAQIDTKVEMTVVPPDGNLLTGISVVAGTETIEVNGGTWYTGNKGSFLMPYADVVIEPNYTSDLSVKGGLEANLRSVTEEDLNLVIPDKVESFKLYNEGGKTVSYGAGAKSGLVLVAPEGKLLKVTGSVALDYSAATISVFDGDLNGTLVNSVDGYVSDGRMTSIGTIYSTGNMLSVKLEDDDNSANSSEGLDLTVTVVNPEEKHEIVSSSVSGGSIVFGEANTAAYGETVSLTIVPESGYFLGDLEIKDDDGLIAYVDVSENTKTFTMRSSKVTVTPHFANPKVATFDDNGRLSNYTYFHMDCKESANGNGGECLISQGLIENPEKNEKDFLYWYRGTMDDYDVCKHLDPSGIDYNACEYGLMDVYRVKYGNYKVKFVGDIHFGGYDSDAGKCAMQFEPFTGEYVDDNGNTQYGDITIDGKMENGENAVIEGMCQMDKGFYPKKGIAYANKSGQKLKVDNITFINPYVDANNSTSAGVVVGSSIGDVTISNVNVENANVKGRAHDIDQVGGLVGSVSGSISIDGSSFEGNVSGFAYVGGLVGSVTSGDVGISNSSFVGKVSGTNTYGVVGGIVGAANISASFYVQKSYARAKDFESAVVSGSNTVGGVVGSLSSTSNDRDVTISNTYTIGIIEGSATSGYIIGSMGPDVSDYPVIQMNYHYGSDAIKIGVGGLFTDTTEWKKATLFGDIIGNIRNSESATGLMVYRGTILREEGSAFQNGSVTTARMKSRKFAAVLGSDWTQADEENDGLPFFANQTYSAPIAIGFSTDEFRNAASAEQMAALQKAFDDGIITEEYCGTGCNGFSLFTDYQGHLDTTDVKFVNSLLEEQTYWYSPVGKLSHLTEYTSNSYEDYYRYGENRTLNVAYRLCMGSYKFDDQKKKYFCRKNGNDVDEVKLNGYDEPEDILVNYVTPRVNTVETSDFSVMIPRIIASEGNNQFYVLKPAHCRFVSLEKDANGNYKEDSYGFSGSYFAQLTDLTDLHDVQHYQDTLFLLYSLESDDIGKFIVANGLQQVGNEPVPAFNYHPFVYDADGKLKDVADTSVGASSVLMPMTTGFTVSAPAGYELQEYTVELGYTFVQNPTAVTSTEKYLVTPEDFQKGYEYQTWKKTVSTVEDTVRLDSVLRGITDANSGLEYLKITVTPTYEAIDYNVVFDIKGTDSIAINVPNYGSYKFSYEVYAPKDLTSLPTSYNLDAQNKNLPMLYAVTQNSAGDKMYASVWTGDSEKSRCVMRESNCATSPNANSVLSSEQIEDAGDNIVEEEGKDPTLTLYPVWTVGTTNDPNYLIIDCDGDDLCESGSLFALKLTQNVTIAGNEYELVHKSTYKTNDNFAGPAIPLPLGVPGDFEFTVNFDVKPGYEVDTTQVVFEGTNATYENGKLTLNLNQAGNVLLKGWAYAFSKYTVSFDLDQLIDNGYKYVILGKSWTTSKEMDLSSENKRFPKVYVMGGSSHGYLNATWSPDSGSIYGIGGAYSLDARILEKVDSAAREFTVYPTLGDQATAPTKIFVETFDANGDLLTTASDYHGSIVLSQKVNKDEDDNRVFKQQDTLCEYIKANTPLTEGSDKDYVHCLYIPYFTVASDTLTFDVSLKPDAGYAMEVDGFEFKWKEPSAGESTDPHDGFGYNAENDTLVIESYRMAMDTMRFKVKYTITGPFYVKYDLNTSEEDEDKLFLPSNAKQYDTLTYSETVTSHTLWEPYRTDKCFAGWYNSSSVPEGSTDGALRSFDAAYAASKLEPDSTKSPTVVYAIWNDCAGGPTSIMTVANGGSRAKIKLKQSFGDKVYTHVLADEDIALGDDTYLFTVDTVGSMEGISEKEGYLSATSVAAERDGITFSEPFAVPLEEMTLVAKPRMAEDQKISPKTIYTLSLLKDEYLFVYDKNTEANVFFTTEAIDFGERYMSLGGEFITGEYMGRADACLAGWSLGADGVEKYTELNDELLKILDNEGVVEPVKLYAVWDESCDQEKFTISVSPEMEDFGKYKVYYVMKSQVYSPEDTVWFDVGKDGLEVPTLTRELGVKFVSTSVYNVDSIYGIDAATYEVDHDTLVRIADGEMFEIADGQKNLILYSPIQLLNRDFVLDVNAGMDSVFFGRSFEEFNVYAEEDGEIPMAVYRVGYKLAGWRFEKEPEQSSGYNFNADPSGILGQITGGVAGNLVYAPKTHQMFDGAFEEDYVMYYVTYGRVADTLYAVWEKDDDPAVWYVVNKDPNKDAFTFKLTQKIGGEMFEHLVADSLAVPAVDGIEFRMEVLYDHNDFEIDGKSAIVVLNEKGDELDILENDSWIGLSENIGLKANVLRDKRVQLKFNENSKDSLFHGSDWIDEVDFDQDSAKSVELPTLAYNAEKCLAGWTTDTTSGKLFTILNDDLLSDLRAKSAERNVDIRALLYAKWTTNLDSCAGEFVKLAVEQENGTVWFAETDKKKTIERRFTDEGTMFVPRELDGSRFKVQASGVDTSVYVLDSLVVLRHGKVDAVLFVGDYMPEILDNVALKAYFGWKNKTDVAFVDTLLKSSGSMFKLSFTASNFEVRRRVSANVQVVDVIREKPVFNIDFGDSIEMGYKKDYVFRMNKPGEYNMIVTLKDKTDSIAEYSKKFSVSPEIPSIAADSWQMLSLASVDMSAIDWDGDQIFYWWDEYGTGEFWQYKQLAKDDSLMGTYGAWYNSLEGRPLPLNFDADDDGEDFVWTLDSANTGWNLVANPYNWTIDLYAKNPDAKKAIDEEPDVVFWRWDTTIVDYVPMPLVLGPYEAVWAKVSKKTKWKMSAAPVFEFETKSAVEKSRALAKATTKDRWTLLAKLTDKNGKQDAWNILGAGLNPVVADEPPESMGDHVSLSIVEGKRALAKSIKESSDDMEWTIALSASSDRVGYLTLDGVAGVKEFGYRVFVTIDGNTTEMEDGVPLTVFLKPTAQTATVRVAPSAKMLAQNTLKGLRMARLGNELRVSFEASEGLAGTKARVDIVDMKGHVMSTVNATAVSGTNALVLDAPQSGLYMLRVRAGSEQQAKKVVVK